MIASGNFCRGDKVYFLPEQTQGDITHKDAKEGVVHSIVGKVIFVRFEGTDRYANLGEDFVVRPALPKYLRKI
jgi:hypothetical protein